MPIPNQIGPGRKSSGICHYRSMRMPRRKFFKVAALAPSVLLRAKNQPAIRPSSDFSWRQVQRFLQTPIAFCRVADSDGALLLQTRSILGNPAPLRSFHDGNHLTLHFPNFVLAYERVQPGPLEGVWFHAAHSTLQLNREIPVTMQFSASAGLFGNLT